MIFSLCSAFKRSVLSFEQKGLLKLLSSWNWSTISAPHPFSSALIAVDYRRRCRLRSGSCTSSFLIQVQQRYFAAARTTGGTTDDDHGGPGGQAAGSSSSQLFGERGDRRKTTPKQSKPIPFEKCTINDVAMATGVVYRSLSKKFSDLGMTDPRSDDDDEPPAVNVPDRFYEYYRIVHNTTCGYNEAGRRDLIESILHMVLEEFDGRLVLVSEYRLSAGKRTDDGRMFKIGGLADYSIASGLDEKGEKIDVLAPPPPPSMHCVVIEAKKKVEADHMVQAYAAGAALHRESGGQPVWAVVTTAADWDFYYVYDDNVYDIGQVHIKNLMQDKGDLKKLFHWLYAIAKDCDNVYHPAAAQYRK